ncbi:MAG: cob(I)yrinic acid a,c-diamide adenosyltransferase [Flavobacteriales bacterium]
MKIYTRKGDKGQTGVFKGKREYKDSPRIECLGTLDEANSTIGMLRAEIGENHDWQSNLHKVQKDLMDMMSHLSKPSDSKRENKNPRHPEGPEFCENWIDELESAMSSPSDYFLLPGGNRISALCHKVRTEMRRAERRLVTLMHEDPDCVEEYVSSYINRLSDLFFTLSRAEMDRFGIPEEKWNLFLYKKKNRAKT